MTLRDIRPAEEIPALLEAVNRQRGLIVASGGVWRHRKKDGTLIDVAITVSTVEFEGAPARLVLAHDVSERKKVQEELRKHAELLDLTSDAVIVRSMEDRITFWNRGAQRLYGWTTAETLGQVSHRLLRTRFPHSLAVIKRDLARTGYWEGELVHITRTGRQVVVDSRWALQLDKQGSALAVLETNTDITAKKHAEKALQLANDRLEARVEERTAELQAANQARKVLERQILAISEREQRRIGHDLHDDLCQQLAGIEFLSNALRQQLDGKPESGQAAEIARLIRTAIEHTRRLARGLAPIELKTGSLLHALQSLAGHTVELFGIDCKVRCSVPGQVADVEAATHLYRIAQEAITNAIKHGKARRILLELETTAHGARLTIRDNGLGITKTHQAQPGMGLKIMQYRVSTIGGHFDIHSGRRGTIVRCSIPLSNGEPSDRAAL